MFAYCNNNPSNFVDSCGNSPDPIPSLADFYNMHKAVQMDIAEEYGEYSALPEPGIRRVRATIPVGQSQCSGQ